MDFSKTENMSIYISVNELMHYDSKKALVHALKEQFNLRYLSKHQIWLTSTSICILDNKDKKITKTKIYYENHNMYSVLETETKEFSRKISKFVNAFLELN